MDEDEEMWFNDDDDDFETTQVPIPFLKIFFFVANALISPFNTQTMHVKSFYTNTTELLSFPKNFIPWRDSNPGLFWRDSNPGR
jgi:hypothetical protein